MRNRNRKIVLGVGAALLLGAAAGVAGVASADSNAKAVDFVDGFGTVTDDFGDNAREVGALCSGCSNSQGTDLVMVWQSILAADAYLSEDDVDGYFGSKTAKGTKEWQADRGLKADGRVGTATWSRADDQLTDNDGVSYYSDDDELGGSLHFTRDTQTGAYDLHSTSAYDTGGFTNVADTDHVWMSEKTIVLEEDNP